MIALQSSEEHECNDEASQEEEGFMGMSPLLQAHHAMERMEEFVCKVRWQFLVIFVLYDLPFPDRNLLRSGSALPFGLLWE